MPISTEPQIARFSAPIGTVFMTLDGQRDNWLPCNGDTVDGEIYPELRALLDTNLFLAGSTPDMRPRDPDGTLLSLAPGEFNSRYGGTYVPHYVIARIM